MSDSLVLGFRGLGRTAHSGRLLREQVVDLCAVEAHYHFAVDHRDGRGAGAEGEQLLERGGVVADVLLGELDTLLRKILFLAMARRSPSLREQGDGLSHLSLPAGFASRIEYHPTTRQHWARLDASMQVRRRAGGR